jgi:hypothetical protein
MMNYKNNSVNLLNRTVTLPDVREVGRQIHSKIEAGKILDL